MSITNHKSQIANRKLSYHLQCRHAAVPRGHLPKAFLFAFGETPIHGHRRVDAYRLFACVSERLLDDFRVVASHKQPYASLRYWPRRRDRRSRVPRSTRADVVAVREAQFPGASFHFECRTRQWPVARSHDVEERCAVIVLWRWRW